MSTSVYIHLPYCITKCPYCDFNSYGVGGSFPEDDYTSAVMREIDSCSGYLSLHTVSTIFFGGGTPSLFRPESIEKIIKKVGEYAVLAEDVEISIEINPRTADLEKLRHFRDVGINRASVGIQSFSDRKLKFLGRFNSPEEGKSVLRDVARAGFENFSLDLIYGSSDETFSEIEYDINVSLELNVPHVSAYCLTIEDGTRFGDMYGKGLLRLPEDEDLSRMFTLTDALLVKNDFEHYEISNFCKPGFECRHNLTYWECGSYIGVGAGAHSHLNGEDHPPWGERWTNFRDPKAYIKAVKESGSAREFTERLSRDEALTDRLLMGLRLKKGVNIGQIEKTYGAVLCRNGLKGLAEDGLLEEDSGNLRITDRGRIFSNRLIYSIVEAFKPLC